MNDAVNEPQIDADEILAGIESWVAIESPSSDGAAVNRVADRAERWLKALGARTERIAGRDGYGDILRARTPWGGEGPGILVLAHLDTVHPHGTRERNPIRREGDRVYGPGIYDMKGGAYLAVYALQHLVRLGRRTRLPIEILFMPDEEVGSPTSRTTIEAAAANARHVLVVEPARDGGKVVTARKGSARFELAAEGRPAHSGGRHQDGRSAIREVARQVLALEAMTDYAAGLTLNVGTVAGGTEVNVVPQHCRISVDVRLPDAATGEAACAAIRALRAHDPDVRLTVAGGVNRPPYAKDANVTALFEHARALAPECGIAELVDTASGGGSDGNFTAALGVPTLDGLGPDGAGAHTEEEHLLYSSLVPRTRLLVRLYETLA